MFFFDFSWPIQHFLNQFWWQINFLLLVILVILGFLSWKKPAYAAGLTIILLPTYLFRAKIWFVPFTFLELCVWVTFIGWLIKAISFTNVRGRERSPSPSLQTPPLASARGSSDKSFGVGAGSDEAMFSAILTACRQYQWPIILIITGATISTFLGPNLAAAAGIWKAYFIEPVMFFLILTSILKTEKNKKIILWSLGISTLSISLLAIFQKFTGFGIAEPGWVNPAARRVTAIFTSPNAVGLYLAPVALVYLGWLMEAIKRWSDKAIKPSGHEIIINFSKILIIVLALIAILFTKSAGAYLGLGAGLVFFAIFGGNKKITAGLVLAALIIALILPFSREKIFSLMSSKDASGQNRLALIRISKDYLLASPKNFIFGAGLGGFARIQNQSRDPLKLEPLLYPHNIILNFWLETGLLGLFGFLWLIILFFKNGFKKILVGAYGNTPLRLAVMAALVYLIVHGLIDVPYFKNDLAVLFWVIIGLL